MTRSKRGRALLGVAVGVGFAGVGAVPSASAAPGPDIEPQTLRVEHADQPVGIGEPAPLLSWRARAVAARSPAARQTAYEIQAATSVERLRSGRIDVWSSGRVESGDTSDIVFDGAELRSRERVVWRVRVWDGDGDVSAWSEPSSWEMGLLSNADWSARWIENPDYDYLQPDGRTVNPNPVFGTSFAAGKPVARARLYITGLGLYAAELNGRPVGDAVLEPGQTTYADEVDYRTYDVTGLIAQGVNTLGVETGNGAYQRVRTADRYFFGGGLEVFRTYGEPKVIAQLEVTYGDGTKTTVASDADWRTSLGATTYTSWWGGEDFDARRLPQDWTRTPDLLDDAGWRDAGIAALDVTTTPRDTTPLVADPRPPVTVQRTAKPVSITRSADGSYVLDFGVELTGWPTLKVQGAAGTKVTLTPGEELNPDGTVSYRSMVNGDRAPPITYGYTLDGNGVEHWNPQFTYNGFRYLKVEGLPAPPTDETVTLRVLRASNRPSATFESSNPLLNDIHAMTKRAMDGNMYSVLTDTPNREKGPYTGDNLHNIDALLTDYDMAAYQPQLVKNMATAQRKPGDDLPGLIANIAPEYHRVLPIRLRGDGGQTIQFLDEVNWGGAIVMIPWKLYEVYGDTRTMARYYDNMVKWMDYEADQKARYGSITGLGDWSAFDPSTPQQLVILYGYQRAAQTMSKIARLLGKPADEQRYAALADQLRGEINTTYLREDERGVYYGNGSEASNAVALDGDVVPADKKAAVLDSLVRSVEAAGDHITTGSVGIGALFRALHAGGRDDVIYRMVTTDTMPGYGYLLRAGFTALTEDLSGRSSKNHHFFGQVDAWYVNALAGIDQQPGSTGYDRIRIKPALVGDLTRVAGSYTTPNGEITSAWTRMGNRTDLTVEIPANTAAEVWLPGTSVDAVAEESGGRAARLAETAGVSNVRVQNGHVVVDVAPGRYTFAVDPSRTWPGPPSGGPRPPVGQPRRPADRVKPRLSGVRVSGQRVRRGTAARLRFTLSERATVRATVQRRVAGRIRGGVCHTGAKAPERGKRCRVWKQVAVKRFAGKAGTNTVTLLTKRQTRRMPTGTLRVTLIATDRAGNRSRTVRVAIAIRR